jgi:hypothetical protein
MNSNLGPCGVAQWSLSTPPEQENRRFDVTAGCKALSTGSKHFAAFQNAHINFILLK